MKNTIGPVYLAGGIGGLSYSGATNWREDFAEELSYLGIDSLSPMRGKRHLKGSANLDDVRYTHPLCTPHGIVARDYDDVRRSGLVLINLLGAEKVSIGSMSELAWCKPLEKLSLLVIETGNVHCGPFIDELPSFTVESLAEALLIIRAVYDR